MFELINYIIGVIEDAETQLQVNFANKYIGGGTIVGVFIIFYFQVTFIKGCVQEEIIFAVHPELLVSCFFCEAMHDNEAIIIVGAEAFTQFTGYGRTLDYEISIVDDTPE